MAFRYALRLPDGSDAGEWETSSPGVRPDDEIRVAGNRRMVVRRVVPRERIEEFVDRPLYGLLEVEPVTPR